MKLWYSSASPFVRKAMVTAHEAGIEGRVELISVDTNVVNSDEALRRVNPLGKIPALSLFDGRILLDSRVICAYFASLSEDKTLIPEDEEQKFTAITLEAIGDGIMDAAVNTRYETNLRPENLRWQDWIDGQMLKIETALDSLEEDWLEVLEEDISIGVITICCALGYLDFRYSNLDWRENRPKLAKWYKEFARRPSIVATAP
jgi:glutathione S-transferase